VSSAVRSEIAWMYEVPDAKMNVIPNGVAPARFQRPVDVAAARRRYNLGAADPVILFSGRMEWQKGPDFLMEAMPAVLRAHPNAKLVYVGDGSMRPGIENRAWHLGVAHAVRFLGRRDEAEIATLYQLCDAVCVPSRNEPFGIVILEAWCAGKPVIVTDHGGAGEIVRHETNGLHVSPAPDSIAWGISTMLSDPARAVRMGQNGREECATRYAWRAIAEKTADVYAAAVEGAAQPLAPSFELARDVARSVTPQGERKVTRQRRTDGTPVRRRASRTPSPLNT
jgi:glycosyltransferase involved in cell wall biosynthesis